MSRTKSFVTGALIGAGLTFTALRYHVVRYEEGVLLVPRTDQPPVRSAYADIREWSTEMWKQYPEVAAALIKDGQGQLVTNSVTDGVVDQLQNAGQGVLNRHGVGELKAGSATSTATNGSAKASPLPIPVHSAATSQVTPAKATRMSQPVAPAQPEQTDAVSALTNKAAGAAQGTVKSALESLFAPYGDPAANSPSSIPAGAVKSSIPERSQTAPSVPTSSIPGKSAIPLDRVLDLKSLDVDLGPALQVLPDSTVPKTAEFKGLFSPRRIDIVPPAVAERIGFGSVPE